MSDFPMFSLNGKVAIGNGAASGVGLATSQSLAGAGAQVVMADIGDVPQKAQKANGYYHRTDVSKEDQVKELIEAAVTRFGRIDLLRAWSVWLNIPVMRSRNLRLSD